VKVTHEIEVGSGAKACQEAVLSVKQVVTSRGCEAAANGRNAFALVLTAPAIWH